MEQKDLYCKRCDTYIFLAYERKPTKEEMKILAIDKEEVVIDMPKTKKQLEQSELHIGKCQHESISYNELKQKKFYNQCEVKVKLCKKCKAKIAKLKKAGLVK